MPEDLSKKLPGEVKAVIESFQSDKEARIFAAVSNDFLAPLSLFDNNRTVQEERITSVLLRRVVNGQESSVVSDKIEIKSGKILKKALLRTDPTYLLERGDVTDNSGRHFKKITAFEYAVLVGDSHMYNQMLDCLPKDANGEEIREQLLTQYKSVTTKGVNYTKACALLKMTAGPEVKISLDDLIIKFMNNNTGCFQYCGKVFYFDNESNPKTVTEIVDPAKAQKLHDIIDKLKDDDLQMTVDDNEIKTIAAATGSALHHVYGQKHLDFKPLTDALKVFVDRLFVTVLMGFRTKESELTYIAGLYARRLMPPTCYIAAQLAF